MATAKISVLIPEEAGISTPLAYTDVMSTVETGLPSFEGGALRAVPFVCLWLLALLTYGAGDLLTTVAVVSSPVHAEANPVVGTVIAAFGGGGVLALKVVVLSACFGLSAWGGLREDDPFLFYMPPTVLAVVGAATTAFNLGLLA